MSLPYNPFESYIQNWGLVTRGSLLGLTFNKSGSSLGLVELMCFKAIGTTLFYICLFVRLLQSVRFVLAKQSTLCALPLLQEWTIDTLIPFAVITTTSIIVLICYKLALSYPVCSFCLDTARQQQQLEDNFKCVIFTWILWELYLMSGIF